MTVQVAPGSSPIALCSNSFANASISSELSVSSSSLDSSFRILLQASAAAVQSWLWDTGAL